MPEKTWATGERIADLVSGVDRLAADLESEAEALVATPGVSAPELA